MGIGLSGPVSERIARVIERVNAAGRPVFSLDTPSGFDAERGSAPGAAVVATHTICFGHLKTVERVIGFKRGTGGTAGVPYLAKVVEQVFFPELLTVRVAL